MSEEILVETRGNNIAVDMPGTSYRVQDRMAADNLLPLNGHGRCRIGGNNQYRFYEMALRLATEKARTLGWIV
jgi:hypothetical protein